MGNEVVVGFDPAYVKVALPPKVAPLPMPSLWLILAATVCGLAELPSDRRARLGSALYTVAEEGARRADPAWTIQACERLSGREVVHWAPMNFSRFERPDFPRSLTLLVGPSTASGAWDSAKFLTKGLGFRSGPRIDALEAAIPAIWGAAVAETAHLALLFTRAEGAGIDVSGEATAKAALRWGGIASGIICAVLGFPTGMVVDGQFDRLTPSVVVAAAQAGSGALVDNLETLHRTLSDEFPNPG